MRDGRGAEVDEIKRALAGQPSLIVSTWDDWLKQKTGRLATIIINKLFIHSHKFFFFIKLRHDNHPSTENSQPLYKPAKM